MCRIQSRTGHEGFKRVFYANFFAKIFSETVARLSCDGRATFVRVSRTCRQEIFANLHNAKFSRHSYECRVSVVRRLCDSLANISRLSGEKIKLSDIRTNENENKLHSWESPETLSRMLRDCLATVARFSKLDRNSRICRINETAT